MISPPPFKRRRAPTARRGAGDRGREFFATIFAASSPSGTNSRSFQAMISETSPSALSRSTRLSEKPVSSSRWRFITSERFRTSPSARTRLAPSCMTAATASFGDRAGASSLRISTRVAALAGETSRPMMRFAFVGLQTIDARGLVGQAVPDGKQQAGDDMERALGEFRDGGDFGLPGWRNSCGVASRQCERSRASTATSRDERGAAAARAAERFHRPALGRALAV